MNLSESNESIATVFDELKRRLDHLLKNPTKDNEATRHDHLILPFLTHPLTLGWDYIDLVTQAVIITPKQLLNSHIFRGATPKVRKPDILVSPSSLRFNALVIEEKNSQKNIDELNGYRFQLHEYQALYECVWGLLTDGEKWILKRGFESYHTYNSLDELRLGLKDIQNCIGKQNLLHRKIIYGTSDLVIVTTMADFLGRNITNSGQTLEPTEWYKTAQQALINCLPIAESRKINLKLHPYNSKVRVTADIDSLLFITDCFIKNAIRFNKVGGNVDISFSYNMGNWTMTVKDDGFGIHSKILNKLFERNFYISPTNKDMDSNLDIRDLIVRFRGSLHIASAKGKGSELNISLPEFTTHTPQKYAGS